MKPVTGTISECVPDELSCIDEHRPSLPSSDLVQCELCMAVVYGARYSTEKHVQCRVITDPKAELGTRSLAASTRAMVAATPLVRCTTFGSVPRSLVGRVEVDNVGRGQVDRGRQGSRGTR